jgi:hypothetical protein
MLCSGDLEVFNMTSRLRTYVFETIVGVEFDDAKRSRAMSTNNLMYIRRIGFSLGDLLQAVGIHGRGEHNADWENEQSHDYSVTSISSNSFRGTRPA